MKNRLVRKYPPYSGPEPYVYLCFCDSDAETVEPLLSELFGRGVRVWYRFGKSRNLKEANADQTRINECGLMLVYLSENLRNSVSIKSDILFQQSRNKDIVIFDSKADSNTYLDLGLAEDTIKVSDCDELIHTEKFTQQLIGLPARTNPIRPILIALAVIMAILVVASATIIHNRRAKYKSNPESVTVLSLEKLPEDWSELEKYPNLEKIIIPQSEALKLTALPNQYHVAIVGEG